MWHFNFLPLLLAVILVFDGSTADMRPPSPTFDLVLWAEGHAISWSHDNTLVAVVGTYEDTPQNIVIWDTSTWTVKHTLSVSGTITLEHEHGFLEWSYDDRLLAVATTEEVIVWETSNYTRTWQSKTLGVYIDFHPYQHILAIQRPNRLERWDLDHNEFLGWDFIDCSLIAWHPDGKTIACNFTIVDVLSHQFTPLATIDQQFSADPMPPTVLRWIAHGQYLLTTINGCGIVYVNLTEVLYKLCLPYNRISYHEQTGLVAIAPTEALRIDLQEKDAPYLLKRTITIYSLKANRKVTTITYHLYGLPYVNGDDYYADLINNLWWSPDGRYLAIVTHNGRLFIWHKL